MGIFLFAVVLVLFVVLWIIILNNGLIRRKNKIDEARSGIEVALTKRYDMLTKLLDVAKAYSRHELEVLMKMVQIRQGMTLEEMEKADSSMNQVSKKVLALAEAYPELHSETVYKELQIGIRDAEDHLQAARRTYNSNVTDYNTAIETTPGNYIAKIRKLQKEELYQTDELHQQDVKMSF